MAMQAFYNEFKGLKVCEVPNHLKLKLIWSNIKKLADEAVDRYIEKYFKTSSVEPLFHICIRRMIFSYLVTLSEERRHLEHQPQHAHH